MLEIKESLKQLNKNQCVNILLSLIEKKIINEEILGSVIAEQTKQERITAEQQDIFDCYATIYHHRILNKSIQVAIKKALKLYSVEEIKTAINHYKKILYDEDYYFNYRWKLEDFLTRGSGISTFLDSGEKWENYLRERPLMDTSQFFKPLWEIYSKYNSAGMEFAKKEFDKKFIGKTEDECFDLANYIHKKILEYIKSTESEFILRFDRWLQGNIRNGIYLK